VSVSLAKVGEANFALGRLDDARRHYLDAAAIGEDLARADPERFETDVDLAAVLFMLGEVEGRSAKPTEAAAYYERALRMLRQLAQSGKLESQPKCRDLLAQVEERLRSHAGPASRPAP
jgi:tetratricopeptide (TPR) repeat protein